ncbi:MAG: PAS domain-containing protein [Rhizomicrobium sp.]|nr:PAS domain-containing protein [Rhizomicrobium sp.]
MDFQPLFEREIHPSIAVAARYCSELAANHEIPNRQDFRPNKVRSILGYLFLLDVLPGDYRFSLCGVHVSVLYGVNPTGTRLSEFSDRDMSGRLTKTYDEVVAARSFQYVRGQCSWPDHSVQIERLLVPMTGPSGQLDAIFGVTIPKCPVDLLVIYAGTGIAKLVIDEQITGKALAL